MEIAKDITELIKEKALKEIRNSIDRVGFQGMETTIADIRGGGPDEWVADLAISIVESADAVTKTFNVMSLDQDTTLKLKFSKSLAVGKDLAVDLNINGGEEVNRNIANAFFGGSMEYNDETVVVSADRAVKQNVIDNAANRMSIKVMDRLLADKEIIELSQKKVNKETK